MAILVSHRWSDSTLKGKWDKWTAEEAWDVCGVSDKLAAVNAVGVDYGDTHPDNPFMQAQDFQAVNNKGPLAWIVKWNYAYGDPGKGGENPLNEPYTINWEFTDESYPVDRDLDGNPIVNAAGDPYDPPPTRSRKLATLIVIRNQPFFSAPTALQYMDHVNSDAFSIAGAGGVGAQQSLCQSIRPASSYKQNAKFVPVEYRFEFRPDTAPGQTGTNPFQLRTVNQGRTAWYNDSGGNPKPGKIVDGDGQPVSMDVKLDETGKPIRTEWKVTAAKADPVANPNKPAGFDVAPESTGDVKYLRWKNVPLIAFSGLGL